MAGERFQTKRMTDLVAMAAITTGLGAVALATRLAYDHVPNYFLLDRDDLVGAFTVAAIGWGVCMAALAVRAVTRRDPHGYAKPFPPLGIFPVAALIGTAGVADDEDFGFLYIYYWGFFSIGLLCLFWTGVVVKGGSWADDEEQQQDHDTGDPEDPPFAPEPSDGHWL